MTTDNFSVNADPTSLVSMLETFVRAGLQKSLPNQENDSRLYHWRSANQKEIDILAESTKRLVGIEVKASSTIDEKDLKNLKGFAGTGPGKSKQVTGIVFYLGENKLTFGGGIYALAVSILWSKT